MPENPFRMVLHHVGFGFAACLYACVSVVSAGETTLETVRPAASQAKVDLLKDKVYYAVATAYLETQYKETIQDAIRKKIPDTLRGNFALFDKYPSYVFNFDGAFRYRLIQEYHPEEFRRLKEYIAKGQWAVAGSWLEAADPMIPSPEALIRHALYGNGFIKQEFGEKRTDVFLPWCFNAGYALPSVMRHCRLRGFSTDYLTWWYRNGIPFDLGQWQGVDGSRVIAALDGYSCERPYPMSKSQTWIKSREKDSIRQHQIRFKYFGPSGRAGGAPPEESVQRLQTDCEAAAVLIPDRVQKGAQFDDGPFKVVSAASDRMFREMNDERMALLPLYKGEWVKGSAGAGTFSSAATLKRWNRKNELHGDAAERAAAVADWFGAASYPGDKLRAAWIRFLWHGFHKDLGGMAGTAANRFSWNDYVLSLGDFHAVLTDSVGGLAEVLDTTVEGTPVVVYNPLSVDRRDVCLATIEMNLPLPPAVRVFDPRGAEVLSQEIGREGNRVTVLFLADVPSVGFAVYDARPAKTPCEMPSDLVCSTGRIENAEYAVTLNGNGDVSSIRGKRLGDRELLAAPLRLSLTDINMHHPQEDLDVFGREARGYAGGPVRVRVLEEGPLRATCEVLRSLEHSVVRQRIRLTAGGGRVDFDTEVDWRTKGTVLKAEFPLTIRNPRATWDLGLGVMERTNSTVNLHEVCGQQWADLSAPDGSYGVAVLNDCKYGWDKPSDNLLRLTLILSDVPYVDCGFHRFTYSVYGHAGNWVGGEVAWQAARLNQPLLTFQTVAHVGALGKRLSLLRVNTPRVAVRAFKKAETGERWIIRLQELAGKPAEGVTVEVLPGIAEARELYGDEESLGPAQVRDGKLFCDLGPFAPKTFSMTVRAAPGRGRPVTGQPVALPFDADVVSCDGAPRDGDMDGAGNSLPAELFPKTLACEGIPFSLGSSEDGQKNAVTCHGQKIPLPAKTGHNRLYLLAAATEDTRGRFRAGTVEREFAVPCYTGFVGAWDTQYWDDETPGNSYSAYASPRDYSVPDGTPVVRPDPAVQGFKDWLLAGPLPFPMKADPTSNLGELQHLRPKSGDEVSIDSRKATFLRITGEQVAPEGGIRVPSVNCTVLAFTVLEIPEQRCYRLIAPFSKSVSQRIVLGGVPLRHRQVLDLEPGRYPLLVVARIGEKKWDRVGPWLEDVSATDVVLLKRLQAESDACVKRIQAVRAKAFGPQAAAIPEPVQPSLTRPGFVKKEIVAWIGTHRHKASATPSLDGAYEFCYLFRYRMDLPTDATELALPDNPKIRLFAVTLATNGHEATCYAGDFLEEEVRPMTAPQWYSDSDTGDRTSSKETVP